MKEEKGTLISLYDPLDNVFGFLSMDLSGGDKLDYLYQYMMVWFECDKKEDIKHSLAQCYDTEKSPINQDLNKIVNCFHSLGSVEKPSFQIIHENLNEKFVFVQREDGEKGQDGLIDYIQGLADEIGAEIVDGLDPRCPIIKQTRLANERFEKLLEGREVG